MNKPVFVDNTTMNIHGGIDKRSKGKDINAA
jgi:hypothetical protein